MSENPLESLGDFLKTSLEKHESMQEATRRNLASTAPAEERRTFTTHGPPTTFAPPSHSGGKRMGELPKEFGGGRFTISGGDGKVYVSLGSVARTKGLDTTNDASEGVEPSFPELNGQPMNADPQPYFSPSVGTYRVLWVDNGGAGEVKLATTSEAIEDDYWLIGTLRRTASGDIEDIVQLWGSDISWPETESSSSGGSSDASSEESSGTSSEASEESGDSSGKGSDESGTGSEEGSEKSSNAIVRMPWNPDGFGALATVESDEVPLEFAYRKVPIEGIITRVKIDPRHVFVCEPGSLEVLGQPVGPRPRPVGAEVVGNEVLIHSDCIGELANPWVNFKLSGIRRGFGNWKMPNRTATQKAQADATNAAAYER